MWLPIVLSLVFFIGAKADVQSDLDKCLALVDEKELEDVMSLSGEEQLDTMCSTFTRFINCVDNVIKKHVGMNLVELEIMTRGTDIGKPITLIVNLMNVIEEFCTDGTELHEDYLQNIDCYQEIGLDSNEYCRDQATLAYEAYQQFEDRVYQEEDGTNTAMDEASCMKMAYELGCHGAIVHEKCGNQSFEVFKTLVKKIGIFRIGICSDRTMAEIKTSFADSLEMSSSRKELFQQIFSLKRRRK